VPVPKKDTAVTTLCWDVAAMEKMITEMAAPTTMTMAENLRETKAAQTVLAQVERSSLIRIGQNDLTSRTGPMTSRSLGLLRKLISNPVLHQQQKAAVLP